MLFFLPPLGPPVLPVLVPAFLPQLHQRFHLLSPSQPKPKVTVQCYIARVLIGYYFEVTYRLTTTTLFPAKSI